MISTIYYNGDFIPSKYGFIQNNSMADNENIPEQNVAIPIIDAPSGELLQVTGCTAGNQDMFNTMQMAVDCACSSEGPNASLCRAVIAGNIAFTEPFSSMIDLIQNDSNCGTNIPSQKRQQAYNAFSEVTGYKPINLSNSFNTISSTNKTIVNFTASYIFAPVFIVIIIAVWIMVGFGWFNWAIGIYLTGLAFIILYGFSILYRLHTDSFIDSQNTKLQNDAVNAQQNFANSIAYWPQGLFAVASAVNSTGSTGWLCNGPTSIQGCASGNCPESKEVERSKDASILDPSKSSKSNDVTALLSKEVKRRRIIRRRRN